ncbi:MAG: citramalate synthase [Anaerolineae bacterium]|nr:citramalate synthase [Anaerolineae bacterium]
MIRRIMIYDTTLRDGTQREGISLSCNDKLRIAQRLDELGVAYIEGGWPGSNPKDAEFFQRQGELNLQHAKIAAFGSTCRAGLDPGEDANIQALLDANTPVCTVVGKTWELHVAEVLRTTLEENLRMIEESLRYLCSQGREVIYDAEHFFDGYKANPEYARQTLDAAVRGGASTVVLCDTNGGSLPFEIGEIVNEVRHGLAAVTLGIHTHNDGECAVANTLAAVAGGAGHVQGTINGYGERCGNANLCSILPNLELKMGLACLPPGKLRDLHDTARFVAEIANLAPDTHAAYVGKSAFAHKGGIHVAAMLRNADSYQHIDPALVGNEMRTVVSELSGRGNLRSMADELALEIDNEESLSGVLGEIKELEARGFSFEAAEASVALMMQRSNAGYVPPFEVIDFTVTVKRHPGQGVSAEATVKVCVDGEIYHTAADGNGPVHALDSALRKALAPVFPKLEEFRLTDYKVRILDGNNGTRATTRVLIDTQNGQHRWSTVGASGNIIEASWQALTESFEYGLTK